MSCKVRIDAPAGIVELEGEAQFVSDFFEKLLPIIEKVRFGAKPAASAPNGASDQVEEFDEPETEVLAPKKKRKAGKRPPAGQSCRSRINTLRADGFFKERRSVTDIAQGLAKKGWTHTVSQVGAALSNMFNAGEIQRTKEGTSFEYFWDRG